VNDQHPNLAPRVLPGVDFGAGPGGMAYLPAEGLPGDFTSLPQVETDADMVRGLENRRSASLVSDETWTWIENQCGGTAAAASILARLKAERGVDLRISDVVRQRYSAHGTACAGLIMGAPAEIDPDGCTICGVPVDEESGPLPYWGVAPGARLLPITVSARPTPEQLVLAFLYARSYRDENGRGVSVIHFPREISDPWRSPRFKSGYGDTRYVDPDSQPAWDLLHCVIHRVSSESPVVCAAGNTGLDRLIYPASMATADNGIISVGSVSYAAYRSGYSNYADAGQVLTIAAPSDDAEIYTREQVRLDKEAATWRDHNHRVHLEGNPIPEVPYSPQALLTPDIPGPRGYAHGALGGAVPPARLEEDQSALYALFGGTSAASAIVAGGVALKQAQSRETTGPLDGAQMKQAILAAGVSSVSWPWLIESGVGSEPLRTDRPNGETNMTSERQFGAGLLDLTLLLGP
jgi:subtilisin family serine protease